MDRNASQGMLKLILAGVVLVLVITIANYMNVSKVANNPKLLSDSIVSSMIAGDSTAYAAYMEKGPVTPGTKMTQKQLAWYFSYHTADTELRNVKYGQCFMATYLYNGSFSTYPMTLLNYVVSTTESNGYDIPEYTDITESCGLTGVL